MPSDKVCKTIHQYNKAPLPPEDMKKLEEIAADYKKVKRYVYQRYSGIGSLSKLYPGYTVQNEMTESGLRGELGLPSVYFYLAVFDGLGDIKSQWGRTKAKVSKLIGRNETLAPEEKHYLRFLLKVNNAFTAVLNQEQMILPQPLQRKREELEGKVDAGKLHRYLCRQVRKYQVKSDMQENGAPTGFSIAERAYRYGDNGDEKGIWISTKENRKRVFVPLTDHNRYGSQLYIRLFPKEGNVEIMAAVQVKVRAHADYVNEVGLAMGMFTMLTTDKGRCFGEAFGAYQAEYADWVRQQTRNYNRNKAHNPGRKKYSAKKSRLEERLHSYINHELNRFLQEEKPGTVYIMKQPRSQAGGINRKINNSVALWQRGYIRRRLEQKCREQSVEIVEVLGKDISNECSRCGVMGSKKEGIFFCEGCGRRVEEKVNTAQNVLKRGMEGKVVN